MLVRAPYLALLLLPVAGHVLLLSLPQSESKSAGSEIKTAAAHQRGVVVSLLVSGPVLILSAVLGHLRLEDTPGGEVSVLHAGKEVKARPGGVEELLLTHGRPLHLHLVAGVPVERDALLGKVLDASAAAQAPLRALRLGQLDDVRTGWR